MNSKQLSDFQIVASYMSGSVPINLNGLCKDLGIELCVKPLNSEISGELERKPDGSFRINVNELHHVNRRNFTVGHEIGHFILHRDLIGDGVDDTKMYRSENVGKYFNQNIKPIHEREANSFAASMLMPRDTLKNYHTITQDLSELASKFQVSKAAMQYRLEDLGLPFNL
ncbi:hypothetical protein FORC18_1165 [Vibrio parahaemolyticus]|uniref:ImmA/IrrE family metallo-endopeptidase n=12 Tax=Vibrio parahaemolyticus TaxID=670 RepID=UPI00069F774F|nr:ImmA/IrrE family metallo-endopeptidase [Vibrio parahaemolyticus]AKU54722.1 hypothetical protein FORC8_1162 [Vibrio parahaemolyticus]APE83778.1 hypothetical protein FORC18_1165 [Vibrio parahaemolyticus]EJG1660240.1 ImmA/IrrE family metallo-endopeptidase [Vibrio parahaemolyticus]EJG1679166.1 ImmA/IrrE family metallo-endopeptidase [Vibrio parahaemolyticus]EJG1721843.1 ImmA/IrrE family metallo-endopeptidase [Vibrio parahaemolyticus]